MTVLIMASERGSFRHAKRAGRREPVQALGFPRGLNGGHMPSSAHMYDVAVVGGGAAGTAAAVCAAQAGARTALFESCGRLGGAAPMKSVTTYCGLYTEAEHSRQVVFGVAEQLLTELRAIRGVVETVRFRGVAALHDPEAVKRCLDVVAKRAGVDVFFHRPIADPTRDGGQGG